MIWQMLAERNWKRGQCSVITLEPPVAFNAELLCAAMFEQNNPLCCGALPTESRRRSLESPPQQTDPLSATAATQQEPRQGPDWNLIDEIQWQLTQPPDVKHWSALQFVESLTRCGDATRVEASLWQRPSLLLVSPNQMQVRGLALPGAAPASPRSPFRCSSAGKSFPSSPNGGFFEEWEMDSLASLLSLEGRLEAFSPDYSAAALEEGGRRRRGRRGGGGGVGCGNWKKMVASPPAKERLEARSGRAALRFGIEKQGRASPSAAPALGGLSDPELVCRPSRRCEWLGCYADLTCGLAAFVVRRHPVEPFVCWIEGMGDEVEEKVQVVEIITRREVADLQMPARRWKAASSRFAFSLDGKSAFAYSSALP